MEVADLPKGVASSNAGVIAKRLGTISGGRILDVGTGNGAFIDTLMKTLRDYDSLVGVDYCPSAASREEMESARRRFQGKPVDFLEMNAEDLKFGDESFDTVCISHSLHHLADVDKVLGEMRRVLRTGGSFLLQEMYCDGNQTEAQRTDTLQHEWQARIDSLLGVTHNKTFSRERIMNTVSSLELRELEVYDSTHSVDCLFCERRYECEDPKNQATYHDSIKEIDDTVRRIEDYPDAEIRNRLKEEGERIKETIAEFGLASASYLFIIGKA
ncbi:MAG: class I SAM-dependent methyltransferase [Candidatus Thermoplasmatota archaeon]|nr:class I SAM-dependent methyltransferase [Candidatus Thermoplasmatota archaeon]